MKKNTAIDALTEVLRATLREATTAFQNSKANATSDEVKSEGKYDTRGLEASYLAHGLTKSIHEYEYALSALGTCRTVEVSARVRLGHLVCCSHHDETLYFLISEAGGGTEALVGTEAVTIITPTSPIAQNMLSKQVGDQLTHPPYLIKHFC